MANIVPKWRCLYCQVEIIGVSPDRFDFCPTCGKKQKQEDVPRVPVGQCVTPNCNATLDSDSATLCPACKAKQEQVATSSPSSAQTINTPPTSVKEHKTRIAEAVMSKKQENESAGKKSSPVGSGDLGNTKDDTKSTTVTLEGPSSIEHSRSKASEVGAQVPTNSGNKPVPRSSTPPVPPGTGLSELVVNRASVSMAHLNSSLKQQNSKMDTTPAPDSSTVESKEKAIGSGNKEIKSQSQTSDDPSFQGKSQAAPSTAEAGVKHSPPSIPGSSAMEPSQESYAPTSDRGKTIQHPAPTQESPPSTQPTQPGVLNTDQTSDDPSSEGKSQAAPSAAEAGVKYSPPSTPGSSAMEPSQESRGPTSDHGKTIQRPAPTQETPPSTEPTQPGVLNTGLARMHIDDVRKHGRKRDFDGDEGDDKQTSTSTGSNQNSTYAAMAAGHSSGEKPPAQSSVPPNKKPKNSGSSKGSASHRSSGQEDQNTHPPDSNIQSVKEQVYTKPQFDKQDDLFPGTGRGRGRGRGRGADVGSQSAGVSSQGVGRGRGNASSSSGEGESTGGQRKSGATSPGSGTHTMTTRSQTVTETDTSGIHVSPDQSIAVTFHALVSKEAWKWDSNTKMTMRFGDRRLGSWMKDVVFLEEWEEHGESGLVEMRCTLNFDVTLLKYQRSIPYKYLIYVPQTGKRPTSEAYEYLHNAPSYGGAYINRCLVIPGDVCNPKGKYHQFDNIVLPPPQEKSRFEKFKSFIGWSGTSIPNHDDIQKKCLEIYLKAHRKKICDYGLSPSRLNIPQASNGMVRIFNQLFSQKIFQDYSRDWNCNQLPKAMIEWIFSVIDDLVIKPPENAEENGNRMASVLVIVSCIYSLISRTLRLDMFRINEIAAILSMLCLKPNLKDKQHTDLDIVFSLLPNKSRKIMSVALCGLCTHLSSNKDLRSPEWVSVIPLIHFLQKKSMPYGTINPGEILWENPHLGLKHVKYVARNRNISFVEEHFDNLKALTILDPNFLPIILFICPMPEIPQLLLQVPPHLSIAWLLSCYLTEIFGYLNKDEMKEFTKFGQEVVKCLKTPEEFETDVKIFEWSLKTSYDLFHKLFNKLPILSKEQHVGDTVKVVISIILHSTHRLNVCLKEQKVIVDSIKKVQDFLQKFLDRNYGSTSQTVFDTPKEMKLFQSLLELDCPQELQAKWEIEGVQKIMKERVAKLAHEKQIELFCNLESPEHIHVVIADVLMEGVIRSLEVMTSKGEKMVELYRKSSKLRGRVGDILDKVIQRRYPVMNAILENKGSEVLSVDELMAWELWPTYLTVYKNEALVSKGGQSCLHEGTIVLCAIADSTIGNMCKRISSGDITMRELNRISDPARVKQMKKLCVAAGEHGIEEALEQKLTEQQHFRRHREAIGRICDHVLDIHVKGLDDLKAELKTDYDNAPINQLCKADGPNNFLILRFQSAKPLDPIRNLFDYMARLHHNDLFHRVWSNAVRKAAQKKREISIEDIVNEIWRPAFKECEMTILGGLRDGSMKLQAVDSYFKQYKNSETIENHLCQLYRGVEYCYGRTPPQSCPPWIRSAVGRINQYWTLGQYAEAAKTILELKVKLGLTGDFYEISTIAEQLSSSMRGKSLDAISDSLIKAGGFLQMIQSDKKRLDCLRVFASALEIVEWIRKETRGIDDLHNFVSVALHTTAGEDPYDSDRLSNLKKVGNAFGPLIFGLNEDKTFETFRKGCIAVWDAMESSSEDLPEKLNGCATELGWYKSVKESQGSIEETTFGQMNNILTYGCYVIGSKLPRIFQTIHDVIKLILNERDKPLTKKHYSLNEVRDLESKLALIVGKNAENRTEVGVFTHTLYNVCRIAELLIALQQVGNVKYTGWKLVVPCGLSHTVVEKLQNQAKAMEHELRNWEEEVVQKRGEFYQLNYFSTLQLLTLRRELGHIKSKPHSGPHDVTPNVLALLESISTEVSAPRVFGTVQNVIAETIRSTFSSLSATTIPNQSGATNVTPSLSCADVDRSSTSGTVTEVPSLSEEILMSADVQTSSGAKDMEIELPEISEDDLTEEQKGIMQDLIKRFEFQSKLVLKAFEICKDQTKYDIQNWCIENLGMFADVEEDQEDEDYVDEEDDQISDTSSMDSDDETYSYQQQGSSSKPIVSPDADRATIHSGIRQVETQPQLPIDRNHPVVQQLCSAGYSEEQSLEAVERFETLEGAMDYLMTQGDDEGCGVFQTGAPARQDSMSVMRQSSGGARYVEPLDPQYCVSEPTIHCDPNAEKSYLSLEELGNVLTHLTEVLQARVAIPRNFNTRILKCGHPNLIVTSPDNVLRTVLALFMEDEVLPLPTLEEVLICNSTTTAEEVTLLWQRAIDDPEFKRIFCLVHAERLTYQVSDKALRSLSELSQGRRDYRLVIICSNVEEETSHIISKLHSCRRPFALTIDTEQCKRYLKIHFTGQVDPVSSSQIQPAMASNVDHESSCVRLVTSRRSGMGKSLFIQRMTEQLQMNVRSTGKACVTVPLHGPKVSSDIVLDYLQEYMQESACTIYHLDIAPTILSEVDTILFSLLILCGLIDSQGRVWRCHPGQLYAVELTLPENQGQVPQASQTLALTELLPSVHCVSPRQSMMTDDGSPDPSVIVMDEQIFARPICQRVYQYLRRHMGNLNLDSFSYIGNVEGSKKNCLEILLHNCGIRDPSWSEVRHFIEFLEIQLRSCEQSVFCDESLIGDVMSGLKSFVVKFMIRMSRDFATSSLQGEVARENLEDMEVNGEAEDNIEQYQIAGRRRWERNSHPYIFFNDDRASITFVGFMVSRNGDLVDPTHGGVLEHGIMTSQLYTGLKHNRVNFDEDFRQWPKSTMIQKIATVMGIEFPYDPDDTYVLTVDNLIKILAIQMRFRCGIPVVIMGETGCGKTRLIRYMCDLARQGEDRRNMLIMKVHGGTTEKDIELFLKRAETEAEQNREKNIDTVVFFDEANTTDAIGLIKEIMCDRRIHGKSVSGDLKFIAACNPYRKHTEDMIKKLENAGLGFYVRESDTQQKLGKIPLRQLVYRVLDLPPSMRPLVYDFGQLQQRTEDDYIRQIVQDHVTNHAGLSQESPHYISAIAKVLAWSQDYMRGRKDECSFVSLRDVERAMIVFKYFYEKMDIFAPLIDKKQQEDEDHDEDEIYDEEVEPEQMLRVPVAARPRPQAIGKIARALILSLSICYHARLQHRRAYEEGVSQQFVNPLFLPGGDERFRDEIRWCQEVLLDNMRLGENIAKNAALRENVFMMAICIELRIPLFLVGKPGSSKSLAKAVIYASMRGKSSNTELLKGFKEVDMFSYQCSQLSTPESVIEVFSTASRFQSKQDTKSYVAVVVLDEVGLAEDSPNLPLKALHPLLEDGTEGASTEGRSDTIIAREERVAFIGISNWALDPAKMNRGVMVTRGDPSEDELEFSAEGICSNKVDDPVKARLKLYFKPLSEAYMKICKNQHREFFGLRDFYSLIKMLYWMCEKSGCPPTWPQLEHAIKRNFGGLESKDLDPVKIFMDKLPCNRQPPDLSGIPEELHSVVSPDCTRFGLIRASLSSKERTWHGENRYLLFLTENYAALDILKHYLSGVDSSQALNTADVKQETMEPFVLFGSSFPKDKEYTQVCRNINQIKICMETGRTVILLNLENLYESLYDVLNQYYIYNGGNRYVDLGLQTHRVRCRVHDDFKLILIAEKDKVYEEFPTPLINRLEKHFVLTSSVLEEWQEEILKDFEAWISDFCDTRGKKFAKGNAFIGYQKDTPAAVVFQASNFIRRMREEENSVVTENKLEVLHRAGILENMSLSVFLNRDDISDQWQEAVLPLSQFLLLRTATPDAVIRLSRTSLEGRKEIKETYFMKLHHHSIEEFLRDQLERGEAKGGLLMQVTTHSHLLAHDELEHVKQAIGIRVESCSLHEFETELDFTTKIGPYFKRSEEEDGQSVLVIIQCDSGHSKGDLIACARNRIYDVRSEMEGDTHVVFVIHLSHQAANTSFVGFQGDPWISVHIDDLRPTSDSTILPYEAMETEISQLFLGSITPIDQFGLHMEHGGTGDEDDEESVIEMDSKLADDSESKQITPMEMNENERMDDDKLPADERMSEGSVADHFESEVMEEDLTIATSLAGVEQPQPLHLPPQCRRLHSCIQAAASKLQDDNKRRATQRVEILVNLVPKDIPLPLDLSSFHGILIQHVFSVLKQRDQVWEVDKQWVLNEAMDARKLQNGGTFRNVLARKIDDVVVPIFSEIIAFMDRNYNLDLINQRNENMILQRFWLNMFGRPNIMQFNYVEMMTPRKNVPGVGGRRSVKDFRCRLPFSWIIKAAYDDHWDNAKSSAGNNREALHKQLCEAINQVEVGEVLKSVDDEYCEDFYKYYLHDFVKSVHQSQHKEQEQKEQEYNLVGAALGDMVHDDDFSSIDGHDTLIKRMAALHVVYMLNKSQIMWFGQLVSQNPSIMLSLKDKKSPDTSEMALHHFAVEKALEELKPPMEKDKLAEHLLPWLNDLRLSRNAIDTILSLPPWNPIVERARLKWQLIQAMQMFLEHVLLKHPEVPVTFARRLELFLISCSDFLKATTLDRVKKHLNTTHTELRKKNRSRPKMVGSIQRSCCEFFMEVVSNLCFGGHKPPEPDLIKMLMDTVFTAKEDSVDTRAMTPYDVDADQVPVVRSFLLQLLLEHNSEQVKEHLKDYFGRSYQAFGRESDQDLYLLCIQCFEDALSKEFYEKCFARRVEETTLMLGDGHRALRQLGQHTNSFTLDYLEGVAKVRYALSVTAELLNQSDQPRSQEESVLVVQLLQQAREVCTDPNINSVDTTGHKDTVGPVVYLIKLLTRQYGLNCLQTAEEEHGWIVPEVLRKSEEEEKIIDPFVVYNEAGYNHLREAVSGAAYGKQLPKLIESTKTLNLCETVPLLLAMYQKVTLSRASTQPSKQILPDVLGEFNQFILDCKVLPKEMQWMARSLIANQQGGPFPLLSVAPRQSAQCRTLTALVVHAAAIFFSRQKLEVLWPFLSMLTDPARLANAYLPTMEEDHLQEARRALGGTFYACPRGHPYFVGECGRPVQELTCLTCGARIGGISHNLRADNTQARTNDITQTGHDLGDPNARTTVPAPERSLSSPAVCVLRALMHSAFLWACCNNDQNIGNIVQLVKPHVPIQALPDFFWRHLDKDIQLLGRAVGKGYEEAAMTLHLVLKEILTKDPPTSATVGVVKTLGARNAREEWEKIFNNHYIQPVLGSLEPKVRNAMETILGDNDQEHDRLFFLVYERVKVDKQSSIQPHLWTYRSRITLEHLAQTLQEKRMKDRHPILYGFLQAEPVLRATQYLPDIVRLQQCLYDAFHHRLDKTDAMRQTVREFLNKQTSENARNEYQERIGSLQKAWGLVGHMLKYHARLRVDDKYLIPSITPDTTLEYLIPTTTDAGACTTALVDFLVLSHNEFIDKCRATVSKDERSAAFWRKHEVPITHIHRCHLMDYEHQLLSIVLSHCNYSLTFGKGQSIKYDHKALEKHILDRFIHGKPRILSDIPHVVYRKDIYTTVTFATVRKKVKQQERLGSRVKQEILSELRTPARLRETLDVVDIVLGFLSSGGGKADKPLGEYIDRMLKMKRRPFSAKAREYCCLGHILSLWETISVELAKQLYLAGQEPFDSVEDTFLEPLEQEAKDALEKCLRLFDLESLLGTLYEFIETHVKHSPKGELQWPVKDTLEEFLDRSDLPKVESLDEFPDDINICQAIAAWKCIVNYQEKVKQ